MKTLFLISSAIHARFGVFTPEQRLQQMVGTIESIKQRVPDAHLIVMDNGPVLPTAEDRAVLDPLVDMVATFTNHPGSQQIHKVDHPDLVKNLGEVLMFNLFIHRAVEDKYFDSYDRVFKVSGRYTLTDAFDLNMHVESKGKIVLHGPFPSQWPPYAVMGIEKQYMSRLWSWDPKLTPHIAEAFARMERQMLKMPQLYLDIEHLLYFYLDQDIINSVQAIGVEGLIAPTGGAVDDKVAFIWQV